VIKYRIIATPGGQAATLKKKRAMKKNLTCLKLYKPLLYVMKKIAPFQPGNNPV